MSVMLLQSGRFGAPAFSPLDLSPALWVDPSDATSVTISGSSGAYIGADGFVMAGSSAVDRAQSPDIAGYGITGDIDIRVEITSSVWSSSTSTILIAQDDVNTQRQWVLQKNSTATQVSFYWWESGGTLRQVNSSTHGIADNARSWVRVTLDVDNGAGGHLVSFYTSTDGSSWTAIGTGNAGAFTTSIKDTTAPITVGGRSAGTAAQPGTFHRAIVKNGIAGTTVFDADFESATPFVSAFTESALGAPVYVVSSTATSATASYGYVGPTGLVCSGVGANHASAPDIAAYDLAAEAEIVVRAHLNDWTPAAASTLLSHINASTGLALTVHTDGTLKLVTDAATSTSTVATGFTDGTTYWLKATYSDAANEVKFWWAADAATEPSSWTQLGTTVTQMSVLSASTSALFVGALSSASQVCAGTIYRAILRSTIGGSSVLDADFAGAADYCASFTESSSNAATVTITATNTPAGAAGACVSQINDKSGNSRHLTQGTLANMPKYWNGRNGNNCLVFDGSNDVLTVTAAVVAAQPSTHFLVARTVTDKASAHLVDSNAVARQLISSHISGTTWGIYAGFGPLNSGVASDLNWHQTTSLFNGASSKMRLDGAQIASGNAGTLGLSDPLLGQGNGGAGSSLACHVGEWFIPLTDQSGNSSAEAYMKTKWGTP